MTSEIEQKRKELEDKLKLYDYDYLGELYNSYKDKLEGFNLGVSLAQKEFLDKIYQSITREIEYWKLQERNGFDINFIKGLYELRDEIKQSLGGKGK